MTATLDEARAPSVGAKPSRRKFVLAGCLAAAVLATLMGYRARVVFSVPPAEVSAVADTPVAADLEPQEVSTNERVSTTGGAGDARATGRVVINYRDRPSVFGCRERGDCPPAEIVLPAGTRVATCAHAAGFAVTPCEKADVVFVTSAPLRLSTHTWAEVPIRVEPGTRGNVGYGSINYLIDPPQVPHAEVAVMPSPETTGGTDAAGGIVTQADVDRVVREHEAKLRSAAEKRLRDHADGQGLAAVVTTVDLDVQADPPVGESSPSTQVTVTAVARGVGYREDRLREATEQPWPPPSPPDSSWSRTAWPGAG